MKISQKEVKDYADGISNNIFSKPVKELNYVESITLHLSFVSQNYHDIIDDEIYYQIDEFLKDIVFPDTRKKQTKPKEEVKQ